MMECGGEDVDMSENFNQLRPLDIFCKLGSLMCTEVKLSTSTTFYGSCIINLGNTMAKCLVNLPKVASKKTSTDLGQFTLQVTSNDPLCKTRDLEILKTHIIETFEKHIILKNYPSQVIEAYIIISNDDGGLLPTLVMGMCLALIDCGIHVYDVISACSVCVFKDKKRSLQAALDLNKEEEWYYRSVDPDLTVVNLGYCSNLNTIAFLESKGKYTGESLNKALEVAHVACNLISGELFEILKNNHRWRQEKSNFVLQTESIQPEIELDL